MGSFRIRLETGFARVNPISCPFIRWDDTNATFWNRHLKNCQYAVDSLLYLLRNECSGHPDQDQGDIIRLWFSTGKPADILDESGGYLMDRPVQFSGD